jgi:integrase
MEQAVTMRITLTERYIASPKRVPSAGRAEFHDALVPGLALRVTARGNRSYVLINRFPSNPKNPTRRTLGGSDELSLDQARATAREWLALIRKGVDPKIQMARDRAAAQRSQANSFRYVAEQFLERHTDRLAKATEARRIVQAEFVKRWDARPITDILPEEVAGAIRQIAKRSEAMAHISLGYLRRLFSWGIGTHEFGITSSPVERLKPADLIGKRVVRERVLQDAELRGVWDAACKIGYPSGDIVKLLILSGQRLREIADLSWNEVDLNKALITVRGSRMKGNRAHEIPLYADAIALLQSLPRFTHGNYVFSSTNGIKPFSGFTKLKRRLDQLSGVSEWVLHDLRRTARTHFSALPVPDLVRELVIAHARPGLHAVYDQHSYQDEKAPVPRPVGSTAAWDSRAAAR